MAFWDFVEEMSMTEIYRLPVATVSLGQYKLFNARGSFAAVNFDG